MVAQDRGGGPVGEEHGVEGGVDPGGFGLETHVRGEEHAGAERFGEEERVAGAEPGLPQDAGGIDQAVAGQGQGGDGAFGAVAADQTAPAAASSRKAPLRSW